MVDHVRLRQTVKNFTRILGEPYDIGAVLYRLTDEVLAVLGCDGAGIAIRDPKGGLRFVASSDQRVACLEDRERELGDGPCHEAVSTAEVTVSGDLRHESRWPAYRRVALQQGARAVAGVPLIVQDTPVGALSLYRLNPKTVCDQADLETAQLLADLGAAYLTNRKVLTESEKLQDQLQHALESRVVIEQAKGVISERHGLEPAAAFEALREHARSRERRIHDMAREVVNGGLQIRPAPAAAPPPRGSPLHRTVHRHDRGPAPAPTHRGRTVGRNHGRWCVVASHSGCLGDGRVPR